MRLRKRWLKPKTKDYKIEYKEKKKPTKNTRKTESTYAKFMKI